MMVGPDYEVPKDAAVQRSDLNGPLRQDADSVVSAPVPEDWWQLYQDQRLNELVRQALSANTELRVAAANIAKARAQVEVAESQGGFNGGVKPAPSACRSRAKPSCCRRKCRWPTSARPLSASYQFDLWGTFKRGTEAAKANADAVQAAADTARITLVADVVKAYTQVCSANEEYHIARESLDLQEQSVQLNQRLRDAGRGDETQVTRSQTQFKSLRAELPRFKAERETGMYTLAALLAKPVDQLPAGTADCAELPHLNQLVPVGDGAALLKRRPTCARPSASWRRHRLHRRGHWRAVPGHQHWRPGGHHRYPGKPR
jgi:outer membrane protein TolC